MYVRNYRYIGNKFITPLPTSCCLLLEEIHHFGDVIILQEGSKCLISEVIGKMSQ